MIFKALVLLAVLLAASAEDSSNEDDWIEQVPAHRAPSYAEELGGEKRSSLSDELGSILTLCAAL